MNGHTHKENYKEWTIVDISHKILPTMPPLEVYEYLAACRQYCYSNDSVWWYSAENSRCAFYFQDPEIALKFKIIYG